MGLWQWKKRILQRNRFTFYDNPGTYLVRLISQNTCGLDTMEKEVVIGGIASVKPNRGGKGGFVSGQVTGYNVSARHTS